MYFDNYSAEHLASFVSPDYFELSSDEAVMSVVRDAVSKKGQNVWTSKGQRIAAVARVEACNRGIFEAMKADFGFSWSSAYDECVAWDEKEKFGEVKTKKSLEN